MKKRSRHFRSRLFICFSAIPLLFGVFLVLKTALHSHYCVSDVKAVPSNGGDYDVSINEEYCSGFGSMNFATVKLIKKNIWRSEDAIFEYDLNNSTSNSSEDPAIKWISPQKLEISINSVSQIDKKIKFMHGVDIEYNIGEIIYPGPNDGYRTKSNYPNE